MTICNGSLYYVPHIFRYKRTLIIIYCVSLSSQEKWKVCYFPRIRATSFCLPLERNIEPREEIVEAEPGIVMCLAGA